jgi:hypothetical protein
MSQKRYLGTGSPRHAATLTEFKHGCRLEEARRRPQKRGYSKKYRKPMAPSKRSADSCAT